MPPDVPVASSWWLDRHGSALQAVATLVLLGITWWYARLTSKISRAAEAQAALSWRQGFETFFFQLLAFHADVVTTMSRQPGGERQQGREAFEYAAADLIGALSNKKQAHPNSDVNQDDLDAAYEAACHTRHSDLGYYFRNVYHILKYIDDAELPEPRRYSSLLRAQLSTPELTLLLYNALSTRGRPKFAPLAARFGLFDGMRFSHAWVEDHKRRFDQQFGAAT